MAAVAEQESETQLCSNCKKDIPTANFTTHEIHCSRNIGVCHICKESFPKSEMRSHQELEHTQVVCKCSMKMERGCLQEHMALACPLRPAACQHCDLELAFNKLQEHEDYCGTRTERCVRCSRNVMLKDLKEHPEDCGEKVRDPPRVRQAEPCLSSAALHHAQRIQNSFCSDDFTGPLPRRSNLPGSRLRNCFPGEQVPELNRRNPTLWKPERNQDCLDKTTNALSFDGEPDCDLDYLLALSLQRENTRREPSPAEIQREFWKNISPARAWLGEGCIEASDSHGLSQDFPAPANTANKPKIETLLPCEFCEDLYPEEDLILHQTGCNPASALACFSKRSTSVPRHDRGERLMDLWEQLQSGDSRETVPLEHDSGDSLMLPCEFCGIQLEEEVLFHHQDKCDLRPDTALSVGRTQQQGAPAVENSERAESPDLPRRRIRHQGEISPQYLEEVWQQRPSQPARGSHSRGDAAAAARRIQLTSPNNTRENNVGPSEQGKRKDLGVQRAPSWGVNCPASRSFSGGYVPSFPVTAPTRPSLRNEGGRSPTRPAHHNSAKAKPWRAESDYPDTE